MLNRRQVLSAAAATLLLGSHRMLSSSTANLPVARRPRNLERQLLSCADACIQELNSAAGQSSVRQLRAALERCDALCRLAAQECRDKRQPSAALLQSCVDAGEQVLQHSPQSGVTLRQPVIRCQQICRQQITTAAR